MGKSVEARNKAEYYTRKAEAAARNNAISSDDPEAIEKLTEKPEKLQSLQEEMKEANKYYRKHNTMKGYKNITDDEAQKKDNEISDAYAFAQCPYPSYTLQNNNQNIKRIKDRIKALERRDELSEDSGWEFDGGEVVFNKEENRVQIFFDEKPDEEKRTLLKKRYGFIWAPSKKAWQRQLTSNGIYTAKQVPFIQPNKEAV